MYGIRVQWESSAEDGSLSSGMHQESPETIQQTCGMIHKTRVP
jgi:hypothetical protein